MISYNSPLGEIYIDATERGVSYIGFSPCSECTQTAKNKDISNHFYMTCRWLDAYFEGREQGVEMPMLDLSSGTPFQQRVWQELLAIKRGETITYGQLAHNLDSSPRAVGQAVGANPVAIIIPCHRVVAKGALGGYAWGLPLKIRLLKTEQ